MACVPWPQRCRRTVPPRVFPCAAAKPALTRSTASDPEDARWNDERGAVEFTVVLGEYQGTVRVHGRVFQRLLDQSPTPERCLEAFHLQRTRFELRWSGS